MKARQSPQIVPALLEAFSLVDELTFNVTDAK